MQNARGEHSAILSTFKPRSHIHGFDAGLATDTILHHPWQSVLVRILPIASVIIRSSTCVVHPYRTTEIVISGVIRGI